MGKSLPEKDGAITIYSDGACSGNPGPGGWGALLQWRGNEKEIFGGVSHTTNNRMELQAVIEALDHLKKPCTVEVYTDSRYVQQGIQTWIHRWIQNNWKTSDKKPVRNQDLWQKLYQHTHTHHIDWQWVKGHSGHPQNERADELARRGITQALTDASD